MGKFQPGQSGNPGGRPRGSVTALWRKLNAEVDEEEEGRTRAEVLYFKAYAEGKRGNIHAIALILDRTEGKPRQTVTLEAGAREHVEREVERIMEECAAAGEPVTRSEALAALAVHSPEAAQLVEAEGGDAVN